MPSSGCETSPARSVRLRTRALTTTLFSRFLLGDLFIHGIGGAKYDELGDEIARRFFGIEPPGFLTVSMTLWLGLPSDPAIRGRLGRHRTAVARPCNSTPTAIYPNRTHDELRNLVRHEAGSDRRPVTLGGSGRRRRLAIRRANEALQPWVQRLHEEFLRPRSEILRSACGRTGRLGIASFRWSSMPRRGCGQSLLRSVGRRFAGLVETSAERRPDRSERLPRHRFGVADRMWRLAADLSRAGYAQIG